MQNKATHRITWVDDEDLDRFIYVGAKCEIVEPEHHSGDPKDSSVGVSFFDVEINTCEVYYVYPNQLEEIPNAKL